MSLVLVPPLIALPIALVGTAAVHPIDSQEIAQLAAVLPAQPAGTGVPIGDRGAWNALATQSGFAGVVAQAEALADQPMPETSDALYLEFFETGNRTHWQDVANQRRGRISAFALAECIEGQGRFLGPLREAIHALCAEPTWVMPAHDADRANLEGRRIDIDLGSSSLAWNMGAVYHLLGNRLDDETRRLIGDAVRERILDPFMAMIRGEREANWWLVATNNWNHVCLAGVVGAALAVAESPAERAEFILAGAQYAGSGLMGFTPDGYCSEGIGYWNYGFGHFVSLAEMLYQATEGRIDLFARSDVVAPALYGAQMEIADGVYPAFADCAVNARPDPRLMSFLNHKYALGLETYPPEMIVGPRGGIAETALYSFGVSPPLTESGASPRPVAMDAASTWFPQAGVLISRPTGRHDTAEPTVDQPASRLGIAAKGGHNAEQHNHNDVGSYVVVANGRAILLDPGSETYTARTFSARRYESKLLSSYGHPVPVIEGQLQATGAAARGEVMEAHFSPEEDRLTIEMASCYDVRTLVSLQRTFSHRRVDGGVFVVTDTVQFTEPASYATALITCGEVERIDASTLHIYDVESAVRVEVQTDGRGFAIGEERIEEDAPVQPLRVSIALAEPVMEATVTLRITPLDPVASADLLPNGDFSQGGYYWSIPRDGLASISTEHALTGSRSLHITDDSGTRGTNVQSGRLKLEPGRGYELTGHVLHVKGSGIGLYVKFLDADGRLLNDIDETGGIAPLAGLEGPEGEWASFRMEFRVPVDAATAYLWVHSYSAAVVDAYLDALAIHPSSEGAT